MLMETCLVATQGSYQRRLSGDLLLCSPGSTSWDFGFDAHDGSMDCHIDVVLAKVVELVDGDLPLCRVAWDVTLILMAHCKETLKFGSIALADVTR